MRYHREYTIRSQLCSDIANFVRSVAFQKKDFNMAKLGFQGQSSLSGTIADPMADLAEKYFPATY